MKALRVVKQTARGILRLLYKSLICRFEETKKFCLDCSFWDLHIDKKGHLTIGGCDCIELAKKYGTPLHVVDESLLKNNYHEFYESFNSHNVISEVYYSYKTNPVPGILRILHASGAGAEVISDYELLLALKLKVAPCRIVFNGPNKSDEALGVAIENKIKLINVNSFNEIERIKHIAEKLQVQVNVGVRVCTRVGWADQFGLDIKSGEAFKALERLSEIECMNITGIHIHLGSAIKSPETYKRAVENIVVFLSEIKNKLGICIKCLDMGGGFAVSTTGVFDRFESRLQRIFDRPYTPPCIESVPSIKTFANEILTTLKKECEKYKLPIPTLLFEPGRIITSDTQILLAKVGDLKEERGKPKIAILDAGINIANPANWEYHEIFVANKMLDAYKAFYRIVGPICTPVDLLYASKKLPTLEVGDIVAIMDSGAYFMSFSNNFSFPRPCVIMVSNGTHSILRERESYEDMWRLDKFVPGQV